MIFAPSRLIHCMICEGRMPCYMNSELSGASAVHSLAHCKLAIEKPRHSVNEAHNTNSIVRLLF